MRKQFFLLIALMLGITRSASADVPDGIWTIPDPSAHLEFALFNVDYDEETGEAW